MNAVAAPRPDSSWLAELPTACDVLREYQRQQLGDVDSALKAGHRRILVQAPTGAGKTHEIASVVAAARAADMSVLVLATRTRIVWQLHERLEGFGIAHGVIAAALPALNHRAAQVQIASVDTLYRRAIVDGKLPLPSANIVIFDEAHLALGESRVALLERYPGAIHLGFTATPAKISGRPLRDRFDRLAIGPSVRALIAAGQLVKARIFSAPVAQTTELDAVTKDSKTGDYAVNELSALMARPKLVGDVVTNWLRIANGKRTLVFACTKAHGAALTQEFLTAGVAAELLTDQTPEPEREAAIFRLESGTTKVLVNCFLLSYGIDIPNIECISLARPTRSVVLYLQAVGRGMRPAPGKDHLIVIDHGRVVETLGMPHENFGWSLEDGNVNATARSAMAARQHAQEQSRTCPECQHFWLVSEDGPACQCCGWLPLPTAKSVAVVDAELREINGDANAADAAQVAAFYGEAIGFYMNRWPDKWRQKEKSGRWWAWMQTRERFELTTERPPWSFWGMTPTPFSIATSGWLRSRLIAYARRRA